MQLCKVRRTTGEIEIGIVGEGRVRFLRREGAGGPNTLSDLLHADDPASLIASRLDASATGVALDSVQLLPPLDEQEVWAAGVTYKRSREARERESAGAARFYDLVYNAERPELFLKATPRRVVGPGAAVRIRGDSRWNVPEPELALVVSPALKIVGYTIGNDMSSRDIEGENPLYLPQAKLYDGSCALGPVVTLAGALPPAERVAIRLTITRGGSVAFDGSTSLAAMKRSFEDLVSWLGRDNTFPAGVILLTGTGIVPPDHFTLERGDEIAIDITDIGCLRNRVE
ncbi:MAG TPA: fumarylacetoacetate hydrolase family protein [Gemmataceae bacterium]|jgi:2-dehydro-3-deoxy-D-arabinonate dehydratase